MASPPSSPLTPSSPPSSLHSSLPSSLPSSPPSPLHSSLPSSLPSSPPSPAAYANSPPIPTPTTSDPSSVLPIDLSPKTIHVVSENVNYPNFYFDDGEPTDSLTALERLPERLPEKNMLDPGSESPPPEKIIEVVPEHSSYICHFDGCKGDTFISARMLRHHNKVWHDHFHYCRVCGVIFLSLPLLESHVADYHPEDYPSDESE